jgi:hypothetical protein
MKRASTLFLKATLVVMGGIALAFCIFAIPAISGGVSGEWPHLAYLRYPILLGGYATAVPFFIALYQAFRLLVRIDKGEAFSSASAGALRSIKYCGIAMGALYTAGLPMAFLVADADDAPGLVVLAMLLAAAPIVIAVFAAILEKLTRNALAMKAENDLVV